MVGAGHSCPEATQTELLSQLPWFHRLLLLDRKQDDPTHGENLRVESRAVFFAVLAIRFLPTKAQLTNFLWTPIIVVEMLTVSMDVAANCYTQIEFTLKHEDRPTGMIIGCREGQLTNLGAKLTPWAQTNDRVACCDINVLEHSGLGVLDATLCSSCHFRIRHN